MTRKFVCDYCGRENQEYAQDIVFQKNWLDGRVEYELCKSCNKMFIDFFKKGGRTLNNRQNQAD